MRGRHPELDPAKSLAWIHNSQHYAAALFHYAPSTTRVSEVAALNRKAIIAALDPKEIEVGLVVREEMARRKQGINFFEAWTTSIHISNWTSALRNLGIEEAVKELVGREDVEVVTLGSGRPLKHPNRCKSFCPGSSMRSAQH